MAFCCRHAYLTGSVRPQDFQEIMDQLTSDLQRVAVYMDDILVSGATAAEHRQSLLSLLQSLYRTKDYTVIQRVFNRPAMGVGCLGHPISRDGFIKGHEADATRRHKPRKQPSHSEGSAANW